MAVLVIFFGFDTLISEVVCSFQSVEWKSIALSEMFFLSLQSLWGRGTHSFI